MEQDTNLLDKITALCKRRGFLYPGSEIYGGLSGFFDYGPLGLALKENIKKLWWQMFVSSREDILGLDTALIMHPRVWRASGHTSGFTDPLGEKNFNLMFQTAVGADQEALPAYLRPETAQGMFVNFKNIIDSFHPRLPFGLAQIGKAFRNEIAPRDFLFRLREFEQMEIEYFVRSDEWEKHFAEWRELIWQWFKLLGLDKSLVHELTVPEDERAHYSQRTIDFEFEYPFGRKELSGLAYRSDFDLKQHQQFSGQDLTYFDEASGKRFLPHVIEPTFGLERTVFAVLLSSYREDTMGGEKRVVLSFKPSLAPVKVAVFPLLANKPALRQQARDLYLQLKVLMAAAFDDNGNIGKRYRRQDEVGTPWCVTVDFQTLDDETVTLRDRDSGGQTRHPVKEIGALLSGLLQK